MNEYTFFVEGEIVIHAKSMCDAQRKYDAIVDKHDIYLQVKDIAQDEVHALDRI